MALGQLERDRAARGQSSEIARRRRREDECAERAPAQHQGHHGGGGGDRARQLVGVKRRDLGADELRGLERAGQGGVAGHAPQRAPVEIGDVQGGGRSGDRLRL